MTLPPHDSFQLLDSPVKDSDGSRSGSRDAPISLDSDDYQPLPRYLTRHVNLGFDSEDIKDLIGSIESSQALDFSSSLSPGSSSSTPRLPHLPAEILLNLLAFVPLDYVLDFRLVCRGFRDWIDTRGMYGFLQRAELTGWLGLQGGRWLPPPWTTRRFDLTMPARFEGLDQNEASANSRVKWDSGYAVFRIDERFFETSGFREKPFSENGIQMRLCPPPTWDPHAYGNLRWILRIDEHVMDCPLIEPWHLCDSVRLDISARTVRVSWKDTIQAFVREANALRKKMDSTLASSYTFSHQEDCIKAMRRQRLRSCLPKHPDLPGERGVVWALRQLRPLFGKPAVGKPSPPWDNIAKLEADAIFVLMVLRKEAAMTKTELVHLRQLAQDRLAMHTDREEAYNHMKRYWSNVFGNKKRYGLQDHNSMESANPLLWSDEKVKSVEHRVFRWKSQKKTFEQIQGLMMSASLAMEAEDAFDNINSQY
ncbi:hypothetical protein BCR34DRAFT_603454 [Clohesyomyces aquaticus]|uniref:F-box domain-containing protein n=1 Tax=Clohesyomyces aquaticus TaxID=1231657 RepID=A0A1Y1ZFI4_9PLEO|nr:hypothetical protein BCR34DRAFT_603454 [Clohesyomyces aquaticus]